MLGNGEHRRVDALLAAARAGSREAVEELFGIARDHFDCWIRRHPPARRFYARYADLDLFQEAALRAWERFSTVNGASVGEFLAWFDVILRHKEAELLRRHFRAKKRDGAREVALENECAADVATRPASPDAGPIEQAYQRDAFSAVSAILRQLPAEDQRLIELRFWAGLSYPDIGRQLGLTAEAARCHLRRVVGRLRDAVDAE
ncbi:MAG TPA: sigma-70 family RNA polymerase sigma factor [Pirellulales bacterium]|nr:sigma-70 family RNA polymerase sigma factor [Pirellulales bacterium]